MVDTVICHFSVGLTVPLPGVAPHASPTEAYFTGQILRLKNTQLAIESFSKSSCFYCFENCVFALPSLCSFGFK